MEKFRVASEVKVLVYWKENNIVRPYNCKNKSSAKAVGALRREKVAVIV